MLLAGRFKCPSPANPGNKTPFGASVFMHQLLCAWAFVRVLKCSSGRQARNGVLILRLGASGLFWDWSSGQANRHRRKILASQVLVPRIVCICACVCCARHFAARTSAAVTRRSSEWKYFARRGAVSGVVAFNGHYHGRRSSEQEVRCPLACVFGGEHP